MDDQGAVEMQLNLEEIIQEILVPI